MKYTKLPTDFSKKIQINAGILMSSFTPSTATVSGIIGATSGGLNFKATPIYKDLGADIDNCPKNSKEMLRVDGYEITCSGTFSSVDENTALRLSGPARVTKETGSNLAKVEPLNNIIVSSHFHDMWLVCDYSDINEDTTGSAAKSAGFIAIHMINTLSTGGFQMQTVDKEKGKFSFEFKAYSSIQNPDDVPCEIYFYSDSETDSSSNGG